MDISLVDLDHLDLETREVVLQLMRYDLEEGQGEVDDDNKVATELALADLEAQTRYLYTLTPRDDNDTRECLICTESFRSHNLALLPCHHEYCRGCLRQLFTSALTDESLIPVRCCRQNIVDTEFRVQVLLGHELLGKYRAKKVEVETPNRTYCHKQECSAFIPPQHIVSDLATCPECQATTCSICKAATHEGTDCPEDEAAQQLLEMANGEGWKQCHACNTVVELMEGCNHMTCRCGAEFCYVCGAVWTNKGEPGACRCALFDEETLRRLAEREAAARVRRQHRQERALERERQRERVAQQQEREHIAQEQERERIAQQEEQERIAQQQERERIEQQQERERLVQQEERQRVAQREERQRIVQVERQRIMRNHLCEHTRFKRRAGAFDCRECGQKLPSFIMKCSECNLHICLRCKRNRLR